MKLIWRQERDLCAVLLAVNEKDYQDLYIGLKTEVLVPLRTSIGKELMKQRRRITHAVIEYRALNAHFIMRVQRISLIARWEGERTRQYVRVICDHCDMPADPA